MSSIDCLSNLIQFLALVPGAVLAFFPMRHKLRYSARKTGVLTVLLFAAAAPVCSIGAAFFHAPLSLFVLAFIPLFFLLYRSALRAGWECSLFSFCSVCALLSFPSNFTYAFDAYLHPGSGSIQFSWQASLFYLGISLAVVLLLAGPLLRFGSHLIDSLEFPHIWLIFLPVPLCFLVFNIAAIPHQYATLYTNNLFPVYLVVLFFLFALMLFIYLLFYNTSVVLLKSASDRERIRFFRMQEAQYLAQKNYMEQTEKVRHDFRQTIITLTRLAESENWSALKEYLNSYSKELPQNEVTVWCRNLAVNALLNYYAHTARSSSIALNWDIELEEALPIPEPDLCSLLGNLLENAVAGCMTVEADRRYLHLSVTVQNNANLCILSINSFDGKTSKKGNRYLSTKREGSGIGISSVTMTAEKYNGIARFSCDGSEFLAEVMMQIGQNTESV